MAFQTHILSNVAYEKREKNNEFGFAILSPTGRNHVESALATRTRCGRAGQTGLPGVVGVGHFFQVGAAVNVRVNRVIRSNVEK